MNPCPLCDYHMSAFDTICPRCKGRGLKSIPPIASPTAPSIPSPVISTNPVAPRKIGFLGGLTYTIAGAVIGLYLFSKVGDVIDTRTLEYFGESRLTKPS